MSRGHERVALGRRRRLGPGGMLGTGLRALLLVALFGAGALFLLHLWRTQGTRVLFDFKGGLYDAGRDILHGRDPYRPGFLATQAAIMRAGGIAVGETTRNLFSIPVYPAPANLAVVPLSLLPFWLAGALFTLLSIGAMVLGLRLLGVRDRRCFAVALLSWPFLFSLDLGALGPLLVLGAGVAWRWRERLWPPAIALASLVVAKVFPWPLGVWLLVTRRFRALGLAVVVALVALFVAWAVIGFDGMMQYPRMLSELSQIEEGRAVSLVALLLAIGVPAGIATTAALAATAGLLGIAWRFARRPDGDAQAFGLAVMAALTSSPIVWEHYMVLLFVPIALVSRRFSPLWFVPACTPLITGIADAFIAKGGPIHGISQNTVSAAVWLVLEAVVIWRLCGLHSAVAEREREHQSARWATRARGLRAGGRLARTRPERVPAGYQEPGGYAGTTS
jgi:Glycosyltransferase family 87